MSEKIYIPNDDEQIREMIELYKGGLSYSEIGNIYGISFQKVGYIFSKKKDFKARKHTASKRFRAASDGKRKLIDREVLSGLYVDERLSTMKIASFLGVKQHLVYRNLIFYQIPLRPTETFTTSELTPELLKQLFIDDNLTAQQIGDQLGFSILTIRKRLHKFGIKKRKTKVADAAKTAKEEWVTAQELARKYKIPLHIVRRLIRRRVFPNARRKTSSGSNYWLIPTVDIENYQSHLKSLAQTNSSDTKAIIQFRYGYGEDEILEIIEFERRNFSREEIAAIFRIDKILIDELLDSASSNAVSGISRRKKPNIKMFSKKRLIDLHLTQKLTIEESLERLDTTYLPFYLSLRHWGIPLNHPPEKALPRDPLTARRKEMIELYESGSSLSEIAEKLEIAPSTVSSSLKKAGYQTRRFTKSKRFKASVREKMGLIEKDTLEKLYINEGLSIKKIAETTGETVWCVRRDLIFHNIPIRPKIDHKSSKLSEKLLHRLFLKEKLTAREIAVRLDCSPKTVNKRLRKFGIKREQNK